MIRSNDTYAWTNHYVLNRAYTANGLNHYTAIAGSITPTYDGRGNLTSANGAAYGYNSGNMLTGTSAGATLSYDPMLRLYETVGGGVTTRMAYDGATLIANIEHGAAEVLVARLSAMSRLRRPSPDDGRSREISMINIGRRTMKAVLFGTILLAGCGPAPTREQQAIQIAHDEARERFHYSEDIRRLPPTVEDLGNLWRVHFQLRPGYAGGAPIVDVSKSDLSVVDSVTGQ